MSHYEYKVVPAPAKGSKAKGVRTQEGRFAHTVETELNRMAAEGWEYQRAELLPNEERVGLTGSTTHWRTMLIFRRPRDADVETLKPKVLEDTIPDDRALDDMAPETTAPEHAARIPAMARGAALMLKDNGVEEPSDVSGLTTALLTRARSQATESTTGSDPAKAPGPAAGPDANVVPLPTRGDDLRRKSDKDA